MPSLMNRSEIMETLPNRPPFLLIDEIKGLMPGESVKAIRNIQLNDQLSEGNGGLVPAGVSIEMLFQALTLCVLSMSEHKNKGVFLEEIKKITVVDDIEPGCVVEIEGSVQRIRREMVNAKATAFVDGNKKISGEFLFKLIEKEQIEEEPKDQEEKEEIIEITEKTE